MSWWKKASPWRHPLLWFPLIFREPGPTRAKLKCRAWGRGYVKSTLKTETNKASPRISGPYISRGVPLLSFTIHMNLYDAHVGHTQPPFMKKPPSPPCLELRTGLWSARQLAKGVPTCCGMSIRQWNAALFLFSIISVLKSLTIWRNHVREPRVREPCEETSC